MAEDEGMLPPGLAPEGENDDDIADGAAALFGIDLVDGDGSGAPVHIDLEGDCSGGVAGPTATVDSAPSVAGKPKGSGKRKSPVWADFDEIQEEIDGKPTVVKAVC